MDKGLDTVCMCSDTVKAIVKYKRSIEACHK